MPDIRYQVCRCNCGNATIQIRCPHCGHRFPLTQTQQQNNSYFRCPVCRKVNTGSWDAELDGTLIGRSKGVNSA